MWNEVNLNSARPDGSTYLNRRDFLAASAKAAILAAALGPGAGRLLALTPETTMAQPGTLFPESFAWGAATAAMQVEGYPYADGGGRSVWSVIDHDPAKVKDGSNNLVADDTYHLGLNDIPLMGQIGLNSYRLSIGWPRVLPAGIATGKSGVNQKALDYYDRLLDGILHAGITPWVTVYHFDYPEALQQKGGWLHPDSPRWLADYAHLLAAHYSDRVSHWLTINEPNIFWSLSSEAGQMPPFTKLPREELVLGAHHILLGHGLSVQAIRAAASNPVEVGMPFAGQFSLPATNSNADVEAARTRSFTVQETRLAPTMPPALLLGNAWWLDAIYLGKYPEDGLKLFPTAEKLATAEAMATIHQPLDYCAVNLYFGPHVRAAAGGLAEEVVEPADAPRSHYGWLITPELLYWGPKWLHERYGKPIVITENGMALADKPGADGKVHDPRRVAFIRDYLRSYLRASSEGVPLRGYFHWSLIDNWEFTSGFTEQFGLIYVDRTTLKRIVKDSASTYAEVIRSRGAVLSV
jgi:beta-glucosidase